jgi:hypothetical protein
LFCASHFPVKLEATFEVDTVKARDCGLAVTYPLTRKAFIRTIGHGKGCDFPIDFARAACVPGASAAEVWNSFKPVAREVLRTCHRVAALGVCVKLSAIPEDIKQLFERCRVVTLFGHCRLELLKEEAIKNPWAIIEVLQNAKHHERKPEFAAFVGEVARRWNAAFTPNDFARTSEDEVRNLLCRFINDLLQREYEGVYARARSRQDSDSHGHDATVLVRFSLIDFELAFPNSITARPVIDFGDRARSIHDVIGLIPSEFSGVADFSICYSSIIGEALKGQDCGRRPCVVIVNRPQSNIRARTKIYGTTIELLAASDSFLDYIDAINLVCKRIGDAPS